MILILNLMNKMYVDRPVLAGFCLSTVIFLADSMAILELITVIQMSTYLALYVRLGLSEYK